MRDTEFKLFFEFDDRLIIVREVDGKETYFIYDGSDGYELEASPNYTKAAEDHLKTLSIDQITQGKQGVVGSSPAESIIKPRINGGVLCFLG